MLAMAKDGIKTVLVVDDEPVIREVLSVILTGKGYEVALAANGSEALEAAAKQHFDLVVSDVLMPSMDGITFYKKLVAQAPELEGRFIFLTGAPMADTVAFFEKHHCDYVCKPFAPTELLDKIEGMKG